MGRPTPRGLTRPPSLCNPNSHTPGPKNGGSSYPRLASDRAPERSVVADEGRCGPGQGEGGIGTLGAVAPVIVLGRGKGFVRLQFGADRSLVRQGHSTPLKDEALCHFLPSRET